MFDPISMGVFALAKLAVPRLVGKLFGDGGEEIATDIVGIAEKVTGLSDPHEQVKMLEANPEMLLEMQRLGDALEIRYLEENTKRLEAINSTMIAEGQADDKFVRRWRPMIGYVVAFQLFMLGLAVFVAVIGATIAIFTDSAAAGVTMLQGLGTLIASMTAILTVELGILGVNIASRSKDKQVKAGMAPEPGMFAALAQRIAGPRTTE